MKTLYSPSRTWWLLLLVPYVFISVKKPKTQVWVWLPRTLGVTWDNKIAWQRLRDKLQVKSQVLMLRKGAITKRRNEKDWKDIKQYPYHDTTNNGFRHTKKHPEKLSSEKQHLKTYIRWKSSMFSTSTALIPPDTNTNALSRPGIIFFREFPSLGTTSLLSSSWIIPSLKWAGQQIRWRTSCEWARSCSSK